MADGDLRRERDPEPTPNRFPAKGTGPSIGMNKFLLIKARTPELYAAAKVKIR